MFIVIFKAKAGQQDDNYVTTVAKLRDLAFSKYNCIDFVAVTENDQEIALSYWPDEASIINWKQDAFHLVAQKQGQQKWYEQYQVEVAEISRTYQFPAKL